MKVRIGVGVGTFNTGAGTAGDAGDDLGRIVEDLEELGFDSLWLPEILTAAAGDPLAGLAFAAGRVAKLKLGTTMVLAGRNPVRLAKQLATLDRVSGGRLLLTFVLGLAQPGELAALDVERDRRGAMVDEALPLLRRLWSEDAVTHHGERWTLDAVTVEPKPLQHPLEAWFGGIAPSALARTGALADGWLPAMCTPAEAGAGRLAVQAAAAAVGRSIDPEHYGVSIGYLREAPPAAVAASLARRFGRRAGEVALADVVPTGLVELRGLIGRYLDVGFSKFVVRPIVAPESWRRELEALAAGVLDLQV
jgi:probable F420-dependent oxidoreductase